MDENLKVEVDGTIIYDEKFNTVPYAKAAENGVPPGCIMPFAGKFVDIPIGWVLCDGTSYPQNGMYNKLYLAIKDNWGAAGTDFNVPDLRGMFLRGTNEGRTDAWKDPANRNVGDTQTDDNLAHTHTGSTNTKGSHNHSNGTYRYALKVDGTYTVKDWDSSTYEPNIMHEGSLSYDGSHSHTVTTNSSGSESRPNNAAVLYIIKY